MPRKETTTPFDHIKKVELRRLAKPGREKRTSVAMALIWLALWVITGATIKVLTGEWHGFFWGLITSGIISILGVWLFYVVPTTRRKTAATLTMEDHALKVIRADGSIKPPISLDSPHRAMLIRAKAEGRILLRVEQVDREHRSMERLDLFGPLPMVMPMKFSGDAQSLLGFEPGVARKDKESSPYALRAIGADADTAMSAILDFVESHAANRTHTYNLKAKTGEIRLEEDGFVLPGAGGDKPFPFDGEYSIECMAKEMADKNTAAVFVALVPTDAPENALVFERAAVASWLEEFPSKWTVSDEAMKRRVLLYDDTAGAFVAVKALKVYIERLDPSNRALEILRY